MIIALTLADVSLLAFTLFLHWQIGNFFFEKIKNIKRQVGQKKN